jgi:hypothetical protein
MPRYTDKYPDPGPRPKAPPSQGPPLPGELVDNLDFTQWRYREQVMTAWQTKKRQHVVAAALDALFSAKPDPAHLTHAAVWLSYLQELLPEEFFP